MPAYAKVHFELPLQSCYGKGRMIKTGLKESKNGLQAGSERIL
jgi:hypothetical protein